MQHIVLSVVITAVEIGVVRHDWTRFLLAQKEAWSLLLEDRVWMCNSGLVHALKPVSG